MIKRTISDWYEWAEAQKPAPDQWVVLPEEREQFRSLMLGAPADGMVHFLGRPMVTHAELFDRLVQERAKEIATVIEVQFMTAVRDAIQEFTKETPHR